MARPLSVREVGMYVVEMTVLLRLGRERMRVWLDRIVEREFENGVAGGLRVIKT